jgi:23S rRNA (guanosine2251-2'-O)-methyltransferase
MQLLEGRISVLAALRARSRRIEVILLKSGLKPDSITEILELAERLSIPTRQVEERELANLAHGSTHGGVIAIAGPRPRATIPELQTLLDSLAKPPLLLMLEGIDDARNLGFVIRSAEALGANALLIKKHLWDFDPVEIARPASGAYERLPLVQIDDVVPLDALRRRGIRLIGCLAAARKSIDQIDLTAPTLLIVGGEKRGVSGATRSLCDTFATIPTATDSSSLSLSHAAAIVLWEAARQRKTTVSPPHAPHQT